MKVISHGLLAVLVGVISGSAVGYSVGVLSEYAPGPPYIYYMVLEIGLPLVVVLVCARDSIRERLFPSKMWRDLVPFSVSFAVAYVIALFGLYYVPHTT